ncbi:YceI family protein [Fluviicola taffensis]|uniref:YceI family protein n=1 Tax=Fluviicola taffensis (strain DSM 16823 / NCIMB 13979 / RW262) TaxID=755732 RepID=F2IK30_FLUTR|nr:YceI family protein [Fluviicola taffensis]AEA42929.1 YceI family protein [Fluviicola taffensis DSM 16823]
MKKTLFYTASLAFVALGMTACGGSTEASEDTAVTYQLDATATTLKWKGNYADDSHSHNGTVKISEGSVNYKGETFEAGSFTVDMKTIESELTPETGSDKLIGHLGAPDFFNIAQFPNVTVKINSISDTEIDATLNVAGKEVPAKMPVTVKKTDKELTAKGKFTIDFSSMDVVGFKPNPEMEKEKPNQYVKPGIDFELNLVLKAEASKE